MEKKLLAADRWKRYSRAADEEHEERAVTTPSGGKMTGAILP